MRQKVAQYISKCMAETIADADRLKAMPKADRPAEASVNQVRTAYADAMEELAGTYTSISQLSDFELPTDRLKKLENQNDTEETG